MDEYDLNIWDETLYESDDEEHGDHFRVDVYLEKSGNRVDTGVTFKITLEERKSMSPQIGRHDVDIDTWLYLSSAPEWLQKRVMELV